jgi:hypothetical protein
VIVSTSAVPLLQLPEECVDGPRRVPHGGTHLRPRPRADRVDLLKGVLGCVCGRRVQSDGTFADGRHRKLHENPCTDWGKRARLGDEV